MKLSQKAVAGALLLMLICLPGLASAAVPGTVTVTPSAINIGASFNGIDIKVEGTIPKDADAVVRFKSGEQDVALKEKGKAMGILWMNMGTVTFHHCPDIFMVATPQSLTKESDQWKGLNLGIPSLINQIEITPASGDKTFLFDEFVKLKSKHGAYASGFGEVAYQTPTNELKPFSAKISIPSGLKPGSYQVEVFTVKDGAVVSKDQTSVDVEETGFPKFLASLAFGKPLLYGIVSVIIALAAGLLTGLIFQGSNEGH
ncbi:TIGR02186 family protein [Desulfobacter curvatus]|uniref:TIGR02186 family protein n=1 Tax=Desulfobacter curvatus TaxID=2290 RepID=UPI000364402E|nr:TIGR02186 family protein [Desulfobacter curvatus]